jgi:hypothetical protein
MIANANASFAGLEMSPIEPIEPGTDDSFVEPVQQTIETYTSWLTKSGKSERTVYHVRRLLNAILFDVMGCDVAEDLTLEITEQFLEHQQDHDYAGKTIRTQLAELKRFSKWLVRSGRFKSDPIANLKFSVDEGESVDRAQIRFQRLFRMIEYVANHRFGVTPTDINKHCCETAHVCERTTRRDIELLVAIGAFSKEDRASRLDAIRIKLSPFNKLAQLASK